MASLTAQQVNELASQFLVLAQTIGDFRFRYWNKFTKAQHRRLASLHGAILQSGEDMLAKSTRLVMHDVSTSLESIREITGAMKSTLATLGDIKKGIDLAAGIVKLGAAVMSGDPLVIERAVERLMMKAMARN